MIKCLTLSKRRGGVQIEFVCGGRALRSFAKKVEEAQAVSQLLSAKPDEISAAGEESAGKSRPGMRRSLNLTSATSECARMPFPQAESSCLLRGRADTGRSEDLLQSAHGRKKYVMSAGGDRCGARLRS